MDIAYDYAKIVLLLDFADVHVAFQTQPVKHRHQQGTPIILMDARALQQKWQSLPVDIAYGYAKNVILIIITFSAVHLAIDKEPVQ